MYVCLEHLRADVFSSRCLSWLHLLYSLCDLIVMLRLLLLYLDHHLAWMRVSTYGSWFSVQNFWKVFIPSLGLGFLCCQGIPLFIIDIACTLVGVSAELFRQSVECTHFFLSLQQFPLSLQHCPHELSFCDRRSYWYPYHWYGKRVLFLLVLWVLNS